MISLLLIAVVMAVVPYAVLNGRRSAYAILDGVSYAVAAAIWWLVPALELPLDRSLAFALLFAGKMSVFLAFLAIPPVIPRWNENWAAVFVAAIYLSLIPQTLQWPIDGDEPYYLLVTESLVQDRDLDLRNQYAQIEASATGRADLRPQPGDPVGPGGEQYSRTEPFLSLLLIPGFLLLGLPGAVGTIALFGALLVRSTLLLLQEEGVSDRGRRICFALLAFGPPVLFYSIRLWPEVPAAFFLVEALRAMRQQRAGVLVGAIAGLSLLKLRFVLVAIGLLAVFVARDRRRWRVAAIGSGLVLLPLLIAFAITGEWLNVHGIWELRPQQVWTYGRGLFGLLFDVQAGLLFQAPFYFLGILALFHWRSVPDSARVALLASILYLVLLFPRSEWHGGWSPPLRYLVFLIPVLCLTAGRWVERISSAAILMIALITAALTVHGIAYPWRLFHIANGESALGEWLSARYGADFSRVLPSFVRPNRAAIVLSVAAFLVAAGYLLAGRIRESREQRAESRKQSAESRGGLSAFRSLLSALAAPLLIAVFCLLIAGLHYVAVSPGGVVHFEDSHVRHRGGELHPHVWTVARFLFHGGWTLRPGDQMEFRYRGGESRLFYRAAASAQLLIDDRLVSLPATGDRFVSIDLTLPEADTHMMRCMTGELTLDRIEKK
jgi:hypothetical protein